MNPILFVFLSIFILEKCFLVFLELLNLKHQKQHPEEFFTEGSDEEKATKQAESLAYLEAKIRLGIVSLAFSALVIGLLIFTPLLAWINGFFSSLPVAPLVQNILFFESLVVFFVLLDLPFDLYQTFNIEERFKFNRSTPGLWIADLVKSLLLQMILTGVIVWVGYAMITHLSLWWLWLWIFFLVFTLFIQVISPFVIEPLFYHFTPLEDAELSKGISQMFEKIGIQAKRILVVDASRRSNHTNAYFTGFGKQKRIVLFDTLLQKMEPREILAILAHEAGHWKHKHLLKGFVVSQIGSLVVLLTAFWIFSQGWICNWFGLEVNQALLGIRILLITFVFQLVGFFLAPLMNGSSRKHEFEADGFAANLTGKSEDLIDALQKLSVDNLAHPAPHPLYVLWHHFILPSKNGLQGLKR